MPRTNATFTLLVCAARLVLSRALHEPIGTRPPWISVFTTLITDAQSFGQKMAIQQNTLLALQSMHPFVDVTVYTNSTAGELVCQRLNLRCSAEFEVNSHGTPLLKSMFLSTENRTSAYFYGYLNADILFDSSLLSTLSLVRRAIESTRLTPRALVVGRRLNYNMSGVDSSALYFKSASDVASAILVMRQNADLFTNYALDFFFVTRGAFNWTSVPDFVVGRRGYDNWLVDHAHHTGVSVVDATRTLAPVHQTGVDGNKAGHRELADGDWNIDLVDRTGGGYDHGAACDAAWMTVVKNNNKSLLVRRRHPGTDAECLEVKAALRPRTL